MGNGGGGPSRRKCGHRCGQGTEGAGSEAGDYRPQKQDPRQCSPLVRNRGVVMWYSRYGVRYLMAWSQNRDGKTPCGKTHVVVYVSLGKSTV